MRTILLSTALLLFLTLPSRAEVIDRVVAFVDNTAITMSDLMKEFDRLHQAVPDITEREVLDTLVNRFLLIREARKLRLEAENEDLLVDEYIELKVRAFIRIDEDEIENYFNSNMQNFSGVELIDVKDEIERLLTERKLNERLRLHINAIRKRSYVKTFLD